MGPTHGWYAPGYWIISLIKDSTFTKAPLHTIGYDIWWWPSMVMSVCLILDIIISIISTIISIIKNYQQKNPIFKNLKKQKNLIFKNLIILR